MYFWRKKKETNEWRLSDHDYRYLQKRHSIEPLLLIVHNFISVINFFNHQSLILPTEWLILLRRIHSYSNVIKEDTEKDIIIYTHSIYTYIKKFSQRYYISTGKGIIQWHYLSREKSRLFDLHTYYTYIWRIYKLHIVVNINVRSIPLPYQCR